MTTSPTSGRFVWHDLLTTDRDRAAAFYGELFGWTFEERAFEGFGTYLMISAGGTALGGMVPLKPGGPIPPHWSAYVTHPDPDAACERAKTLGGKVIAQGTDIPGVGRFSAVSEGSTAYLMPFRFDGEQPPEPDGPPPAGHFCWHELLADDVERARDFYAAIFDWETGSMDMGPMGTYHTFRRAGADVAGLMKRPPDMPAPPSWLYYVLVEDVDASFARAGELGATACVEPADIPGIGRYAVLVDPTGAAFAVFAPPRD